MKTVTLSILAAGLFATAMGFATAEPILAAAIPATLWAIAAIVRAVRGDRQPGPSGQISPGPQASDTSTEGTVQEPPTPQDPPT